MVGAFPNRQYIMKTAILGFTLLTGHTADVSPETPHEFLSWRRSLREFASLLFKD
jgi:hypothetical protein